jgi:hypothetical protein
MGVQTRRNKVRELLNLRDHDRLLSLTNADRGIRRILFSFIFDNDELTRWRAIEAMGKVTALQAESDIEKTRDLVRRLLWLMSDESGGLGWHSPEVIGEILVNVPDLIDEFAPLLPAYLREEPFERGTHLAVYRVASVDKTPFAECRTELLASLRNQDQVIRSLAALALGAIDLKAHYNDIAGLKGDTDEVTLYDFDTGQLRETTVEQIALETVAESDSPWYTT